MWRRWRAAATMLVALAGSASAQAVHRKVATLPLQHGVIGVEAVSTGRVVVAASTDAGNATVSLASDAAKELTDSIARISARRVGARSTRVYRTVATDPSTGAGIQFARHVTKGASSYRFFFSTGNVTGFPFGVSSRELGLVVSALRRAVKTAHALAAADSA